MSYPKVWGIAKGSTFYVEFVLHDESSLNNSLIFFTGQAGQQGMGSDYLALGLSQGIYSLVFVVFILLENEF